MISLFLGCTDLYRDLGIILDGSLSMCEPEGPEDHGQEGAIRLLREIARVANFSPNGSHGALSTFAGTNESFAYLKFNGEGLIYDVDGDIKGVFNQTVDTFNKVVIDKCLENDLCACTRGTGTDIISGLNYSLANIFNIASGMRKDTSKVAVLITDGQDYQSNEIYKNMGLEYGERDITLLVLGVGAVDATRLKLLVQSPSFYFPASDWEELDAVFIDAIIAVLCEGNKLFL